MPTLERLPRPEQATGSCPIDASQTEWPLYLSAADAKAVAGRALRMYCGPAVGLAVRGEPTREGVMFRSELTNPDGVVAMIGISADGIPNALLIKRGESLLPFEDPAYTGPKGELITDLNGKIIFGPCADQLIKSRRPA